MSVGEPDGVEDVARRNGVTAEELVERIRELRLSMQADPDRCDWCEDLLPVPRRRDMRWCPDDPEQGRYCKANGNRERVPNTAQRRKRNGGNG